LCVTEYMAKAIILKIFLTLFLLVSLLTLSHTVSAQASVDCNAALAEATKGKELIADWSNPGVPGATYAVKNVKKEIEKTNGDSCILARTWAAFGSEVERQDVKMTYFANSQEATTEMGKLRTSELSDFRVKSSSPTSYSGSIYRQGVYKEVLQGHMGYEVEGPLYGRSVSVLGNCLIQAKEQLHGRYVYANASEYENTWGNPPRVIAEGFVDGLSRRGEVQSLCGSGGGIGGFFQQFLGRKVEPTPGPPSINSTNKPSTSESAQDINNWIKDTLGVFNPNQIVINEIQRQNAKQLEKLGLHESFSRQAKLNEKNIAEAVQQYESIPKPSPYNIVVINSFSGKEGTEPLIKYPGSNEFVPLGKRNIKVGSIIKTQDNEVLISTGDRGLIYIDDDSEITVSHEGFDKAIENKQAEVNEYYLHEGEIEVKVKPAQQTPQSTPQPSQTFNVKTDLMDLIVIGTHFWVKHLPDKKSIVVGVYDGTIEVRTKDGKTTKVSPSDNEPGITIVSQRFSISKLLVPAVVLAIVIGFILISKKRKRKK